MMRKVSFRLLTIATLVIVLTSVLGWLASTTEARIEVSVRGIDPTRMTMNAPHDLPIQDLTDYTFVFD